MILVTLYLLATIDGAFCGFRVVAGRNGLINKSAFYTRAMLTGAAWVQLPALISGLALLIALRLSSDRAAVMTDLLHAAVRMLHVFIPYAAAVFAAFLFRWFPSVDIRSATSVMVLGPLTPLRPLICAAGVLYGIVPAHTLQTRALGILVLLLMLAIEPFLDGIAGRAQARSVLER
jgi:hypothetical protein